MLDQPPTSSSIPAITIYVGTVPCNLNSELPNGEIWRPNIITRTEIRGGATAARNSFPPTTNIICSTTICAPATRGADARAMDDHEVTNDWSTVGNRPTRPARPDVRLFASGGSAGALALSMNSCRMRSVPSHDVPPPSFARSAYWSRFSTASMIDMRSYTRFHL